MHLETSIVFLNTAKYLLNVILRIPEIDHILSSFNLDKMRAFRNIDSKNYLLYYEKSTLTISEYLML